MTKKDSKNSGKPKKSVSARSAQTSRYKVASPSHGRSVRFSKGTDRKGGQTYMGNASNVEVPGVRVRVALAAAGLTTPAPSPSPPGKLTVERRATLARRLSSARPMSDLIDEDREGR